MMKINLCLVCGFFVCLDFLFFALALAAESVEAHVKPLHGHNKSTKKTNNRNDSPLRKGRFQIPEQHQHSTSKTTTNPKAK